MQRHFESTSTKRKPATLSVGKACIMLRILVINIQITSTQRKVWSYAARYIETSQKVSSIDGKTSIKFGAETIGFICSTIVETANPYECREVNTSRETEHPSISKVRIVAEVEVGSRRFDYETQTTETTAKSLAISSAHFVLRSRCATKVEIERSESTPVLKRVVSTSHYILAARSCIEEDVAGFERESNSRNDVDFQTSTNISIELFFVYTMTSVNDIIIVEFEHTSTTNHIGSEASIVPEIELEITTNTFVCDF